MIAGIHSLTAAEYHADPAPTASLSSSIAKILLDQSPMHAWLAHPRLNTRYEPGSSSRFDLGSAAHKMLLEGDDGTIIRVNAPDWRTKAAKEARDAAQACGQFAVLERQYADIVQMVTAARDFLARSELAGMLESGIAESSILWQESDMWCRCRPDLMSADQRVVLDYKTTASAAPDAFARQIGRMGYDLQAEFYLRGIESVVRRTGTVFVFLAQEIEPPYACSLMALSNAYRAVGGGKVKRALAIWERCVRSSNWPAYTNQILYCEPRPWDLAESEEITENETESDE